MTTPKRDRPVLPDGYGLEQATDFVEWEQVCVWLRDSESYWLATTRPDGRPHVVPRWGVWWDERFWYDGSPDTIHVRNLSANSACVLHLESGTRAVIVEGRSVMSDPVPESLGERLAAEYSRKYAPIYEPSAEQWSDEIAGGLRRLDPESVLTWSDFPRDVTRFTF